MCQRQITNEKKIDKAINIQKIREKDSEGEAESTRRKDQEKKRERER